MSDTPKRPIDLQRESAFSITLEAADDKSPTTAMFEMDSQLCTVTGLGVYAIRLADQVDPARTNPAIRNSVQRLLKLGADSPIVSGILLTAERLFNTAYLGSDFPRLKALSIAWELTREVARAEALSAEFQQDQKKIMTAYDGRLVTKQQITLPTMEDAKDRLDAFAQKLGHALRALETLVQVFYPQIKSKWIDSLVELAKERYGPDATLTRYISSVAPTLKFMLELRNLIEHPKSGRSARVSDFQQTAGAELMVPSVEFEGTLYDGSPNALHAIMPMLIVSLLSMSEELIGLLCSANLKPFGGFDVCIMGLPTDQRRNDRVRLGYFMRMGDQWTPCA